MCRCMLNSTCKWLLTWASVRSFTSISSNIDFGVAPKKQCVALKSNPRANQSETSSTEVSFDNIDKQFTFMASEVLDCMNEAGMERSRPSHPWSPHVPPVGLRSRRESQSVIAWEVQVPSTPMIWQLLLGLHHALHHHRPVSVPWTGSRASKSQVRSREAAIIIYRHGWKGERSTIAQGVVAIVDRSPGDGLQFLRQAQQRVNPTMADYVSLLERPIDVVLFQWSPRTLRLQGAWRKLTSS